MAIANLDVCPVLSGWLGDEVTPQPKVESWAQTGVDRPHVVNVRKADIANLCCCWPNCRERPLANLSGHRGDGSFRAQTYQVTLARPMAAS